MCALRDDGASPTLRNSSEFGGLCILTCFLQSQRKPATVTYCPWPGLGESNRPCRCDPSGAPEQRFPRSIALHTRHAAPAARQKTNCTLLVESSAASAAHIRIARDDNRRVYVDAINIATDFSSVSGTKGIRSARAHRHQLAGSQAEACGGTSSSCCRQRCGKGGSPVTPNEGAGETCEPNPGVGVGPDCHQSPGRVHG